MPETPAEWCIVVITFLVLIGLLREAFARPSTRRNGRDSSSSSFFGDWAVTAEAAAVGVATDRQDRLHGCGR